MKKNYTVVIHIWFLLALFLCSCRAKFYTPNRNPILLFEEKGDVFADASVSTSLTKYDATIAYALTNNIGAYAGYSKSVIKGRLTDSTNPTDYKYTGDMLNLGLGYFLNRNTSKHLRFEIFADYGLGNYTNNVSQNGKAYFFDGNYQRVGIMPNIALSSGNFSIAYSARLSQIMFYNPQISDRVFWNDDIKRLESRGSYQLIEHCIQFRHGFRHIKFQMQVAAYHALNSKEDSNALPGFVPSVMFGIVLNANILGRED
jgi:hypothetical protein